MADDSIPFVLAGQVEAWDPLARVLYVGDTRLEVAPGVPVNVVVQDRVAVTGHRSKHPAGPWVVTSIRAHRPGF